MRASIKDPAAIVRTAIANVIEAAKRENRDAFEAADEVMKMLEEMQVNFRPNVRRGRARVQ
ncbi:MAG: hypothetical protein IMX01_07755 [Limnochordaceae bacterium]|nr:hypothetical protein [Limnochordaceae bacterium]